MSEKPKTENSRCLDSLIRDKRELKMDFPLSRYVLRYKKQPMLFSPKGRTGSFFTRDSKRYITPEELRAMQAGERLVRITRRLDSLNARAFENTKIFQTVSRSDDRVTRAIKERYSSVWNYAEDYVRGAVSGVSPQKMWNVSIVGSVLFGMLTMTMIYRTLGQNVSAQINEPQMIEERIKEERRQAAAEQAERDLQLNQEIDISSITKLLRDSQEIDRDALEIEIRQMVKGYPIEAMVPEIMKNDRTVAAFIVGIAKQESNWGKRIPTYQGQDCYNYWGWRGKNAVGTGGHTCFTSPEEAVQTVAKRISQLVSEHKLNTPEKMIVWKCGDCSWDKQENMQRWISAVSMYFKKLNTTDLD